MDVSIINTLITAGVTLIVSIGTWHISAKKDREKMREEIKAELLSYHNQNREEIKKIREGDLHELRDDLTDMGANLQQKMSDVETKVAIIENNLKLYSQKVDKHNQVIERTYKLEQAVKDMKEAM